MDIRFLPLDQLRFGHDAEPPINARKVGREEDISALAASIDAHGLGQALNIRDLGDAVYVADGNRRLAALRTNAAAGLIPADWPVPCVLGDSDELGLALNFERVPMHEADQWEKFHQLVDGGVTPDQIASRFGIEPQRVKRILALGALSPLILDAWREGIFERDAIGAVRAFTMAASVTDQERVFKKLKKSGQLWGHMIRQELGVGGSREANRHLQFVGLASYTNAGGKVIEDLFGEDHAIADPALVARLAEEKLAKKVEELKAEGWAWVAMDSDLPYNWHYSWEKLSLKKKSATQDQKKSSGVVLNFDHSGGLQITYGVKKPTAPKKEPAKKADGTPEAAGISNAVAMRLSVQIAQAARAAIKANPHTALAAVLAGLGSSGYGQPISVKAEGNVRVGREHEMFEDVLARYLAMSTDDLLVALAAEAGEMVNFHTNYANRPILDSKGHSALIEALEPAALQDALRQSFDADDYFKAVPRAITEAAIAEAINTDEARKAGKLKKGELTKFAVDNVPKTGWLPPELRTSTYAGPRAVETAKAA